jgi:hypothetical protein
MPRSYVKVRNDFRRAGRQFDRALERAVDEAANAGAAVSRAQASRRRDTGLMADIEVSPARAGRKGVYAVFASIAPHARYHERGTRVLSPLRFMRKGAYAAHRVLKASVVAHLQRVR